MQARALGPFGFQPDNNATRSFEYPWAFHSVLVEPGHVIVDLGGSLGGLQFVLSTKGARVINVDPSERASMGWAVDARTISKLNRCFSTSVELRKTFLQDADFDTASVDRLYCISTIEHIPPEELPDLAREIGRILKPGGFAVLTIDLFYDLTPFTSRMSNVHGRNINVKDLVEATGLQLYIGESSELCGFPDFDPPTILSRAMEFVQGDIALNTVQALVLTKPVELSAYEG
jgi:SAM-dependent methyltransferase